MASISKPSAKSLDEHSAKSLDEPSTKSLAESKINTSSDQKKKYFASNEGDSSTNNLLHLEASRPGPPYYKKYNPNIQTYVHWDQYDNDKLDTSKKYSSKNHPNFSIIQPMYNYTTYMTDALYYKTPFITLTQDAILKYAKETPEFMDIDLNNTSIMSTIISFLQSYDQKIFNIAKETNYKYVRPFVINTGYNDWINYQVNVNSELRKLPLHFIKDKQSGKIISEIINYNVAKKYPKVEVFNNTNPTTLNDLKRFLKKGKEVRFILKPYSWINQDGKMIGSKMQIVTMEVKYDFANIDSIVDKQEVTYQKSVKEIKI